MLYAEGWSGLVDPSEQFSLSSGSGEVDFGAESPNGGVVVDPLAGADDFACSLSPISLLASVAACGGGEASEAIVAVCSVGSSVSSMVDVRMERVGLEAFYAFIGPILSPRHVKPELKIIHFVIRY